MPETTTEAPDAPPMRGWTVEEVYAHLNTIVVTPNGKRRIIGSISRDRETGDMLLGIILLGKLEPDPKRWINLPPARIVAWKVKDTGELCGVPV